MSRSHRITAALFASFTLASTLPAGAQGATPHPAGCTYAACGLRVETGFWKTTLVRGAAGEEQSRLGGFGKGVEVLLAGPDSAAAHARTYVGASRTAGTLGLIALASYAVVLWRTDSFRGGDDLGAGEGVAAVAGAGTAIAAGVFSVRATRELARAIWWYNAALPRD